MLRVTEQIDSSILQRQYGQPEQSEPGRLSNCRKAKEISVTARLSLSDTVREMEAAD